MSYTAPNDIQTKADAIIALASTLADSDLSALGDGTVNTALDVLADQLADSDVEVPPTNAGAILELAKYVSQGGGSSKELLFEETVTTSGSPVAQAQLASSQYIDADTIYVTLDGVEYTCPKRTIQGESGNFYGANDPTFADYPFVIQSSSENNTIITQTAGTHTVKVES